MTVISVKNNGSTGGGSSGVDNFSYKKIPSGDTVTIPFNQVMLLAGNIEVDGNLVTDGDLEMIADRDDNFSYDTIPADDVVHIRNNQQMIVYGDIVTDGTLILDGNLILLEA